MTTVSQEAREAAAALIDKHGRSKDWTPTNIRLGNLDDLPTVQAFAKFERDTLARHRLERSEPVVDSGFSADNLAVAEWLWANMPTGSRKWISLPTHEKALVCHTVQRLRGGTTTPEPVAEIERLREALWTPGEKAWAGLARDLMMAFDMGCRTPREIFQHLDRCGKPIPQWLRDEGEMKHLDHVPSKGTRAMIIYRAMLEPALAALGEAS